jgi:predicted N-acetyltransferase YhbS
MCSLDRQITRAKAHPRATALELENLFRHTGNVNREVRTDASDPEICSATAADAEGISMVILESLRTSNAKDYTSDIIKRVAQNFSPMHIVALLNKRDVVVARLGGRIVGTAALDGDVIRTVFVAPDVQNRGIGRRLMHELEHRARVKGITTLSVPSSITAELFYAKMGFVTVRDSYHGAERTIIMERRL